MLLPYWLQICLLTVILKHLALDVVPVFGPGSVLPPLPGEKIFPFQTTALIHFRDTITPFLW